MVSTEGSSPASDPGAPPLLDFGYLAATVVALAAMIFAIENPGLWLLNFMHVSSGILWTGVDLFMGFVIGPIMRRISLDARRQIVARLMPRMLYLMTTLSIITGTTGWYLAERLGLLGLPYPQFGWVLAALIILAILTIEGVGFLLPVNLMVYFELRKPHPDGARIGRLMRLYVWCVTTQGLMQIAIILIMAKFRTGL